MGLMNKLTASYVAGLIDGEGSIEIQKRKKKECKRGYYFNARIRVCMTDKAIIQWLKNSFGGYISKRKGKGNCKDSWSWSLMFSKTKPFIDKIYPYLKVKRNHGEILKKFNSTFKNNSYKKIMDGRKLKNGGQSGHKELKEDVWNYREELFGKMGQLNKRGSAR